MQVPLQQLKVLDHPDLQVSASISPQNMCIFSFTILFDGTEYIVFSLRMVLGNYGAMIC